MWLRFPSTYYDEISLSLLNFFSLCESGCYGNGIRWTIFTCRARIQPQNTMNNWTLCSHPFILIFYSSPCQARERLKARMKKKIDGTKAIFPSARLQHTKWWNECQTENMKNGWLAFHLRFQHSATLIWRALLSCAMCEYIYASIFALMPSPVPKYISPRTTS